MAARCPRLLCYGHDDLLLFTRKRILDREFAVEICDGLGRLGEILLQCSFDLIVLCQSVPDRECDAVIELARAACPEVKILALREASLGECSAHSDGTLENLDGPPALLHEIHTLLGIAAAQSAAQNAML